MCIPSLSKKNALGTLHLARTYLKLRLEALAMVQVTFNLPLPHHPSALLTASDSSFYSDKSQGFVILLTGFYETKYMRLAESHFLCSRACHTKAERVRPDRVMFFTIAWPSVIALVALVIVIAVAILRHADKCCRARHGARNQNYELNLVTFTKNVSKSDECFVTRGRDANK
ncbi:unnamed protein product [Notodromas monacha]|uniref:Uncharacterized protein n=1 Tax=Notodromas monacha TaxID=399045 RepID=A0A7R9BFK6_9CRUS|nr:unnamed protein product [Notodromas monacha]CAG0914504.1 unnamed protein product [Notodromas monacha]